MKEASHEFNIDPKKIGNSKDANIFYKAIIEDDLRNLKDKKIFGPGDFVTTIDGPFAHILMLVKGKDSDGMVELAPGPGKDPIKIHESELWEFNDYEAAMKKALIEEQVYDIDTPQ